MKNEIRNEFPFFDQKIIFFDNSSTALKPKCVLDSISRYYTKNTSNAYRGSYENSEYISMKIDECRELVALYLNCSSSEVIFTGNCTDSLNQLVYMLNITKEDSVICSRLEHHSNLLPWINKANVKIVETNENGIIDVECIESILKKEKIKIVSVTGLSNVTGNIQPIKEMCEVAHKYGAIAVIDCCQYAPHVEIDVKEIDCDFLVFSGHKICGPTGVGVLFGKKKILNQCQKVKYGGGMVDKIIDFDHILYKEIPYCFEAGTPPIESIIGLGSAIRFLMGIGMKKIEQMNQELNNYFIDKMKENNNLHMIFPISNRHAPIFTFKLKGKEVDMSYFAKILSDSAGICVASGYQCCQPLYEKYGAKGGLRVSLQFYNTKEEVDSFFDVIDNLNI